MMSMARLDIGLDPGRRRAADRLTATVSADFCISQYSERLIRPPAGLATTWLCSSSRTTTGSCCARLRRLHPGIGDHDDAVADLGQARRRAIDAERPAAARRLDGVGREALAIVDVEHIDLLIAAGSRPPRAESRSIEIEPS